MRVSDDLYIDESEFEEKFVRSSGPGGQNVNKVASAVQLRFDVEKSQSLPEAVRSRLKRLAKRYLTAEGVIIIEASTHRSQSRNRTEARERLAELVLKASKPPKKRRPTKPTLGSKQRRLQAKQQKGERKKARQGSKQILP